MTARPAGSAAKETLAVRYPPRTRERAPALVTALAAIVTLGCGDAGTTVEQVIVDYAAAVQAQDYGTLFCLSAGAAGADELGASPEARRASFRTWAEARYETYLDGRDAGEVPIDGEGILAVKVFALGRGTFATHRVTAAPDEDSRLVRSDVTFGYGAIDLSRFTPGTTLYLSGVPVGRVYPIRIPRFAREVSETVLDSISVEWGLVRAPAADGCPGGWTVASATPLEDTATTTELTWAF